MNPAIPTQRGAVVTQAPRKARRIGVCSWSLQPRTVADLAERVRACGLSRVQLALGPVRSGAMPYAEVRSVLAEAGVKVLSGMMSTHGEDYTSLETIRRTGGLRPDAHWARNLEIARRDADLARAAGIDLVTFHAGFLPHGADDPERERLLDRLRTVADVFARDGVRLGLETGQETAETLLAVLRDLERPSVGVNFDPANMILYGMGDPVAALRRLARHVVQVHVKDAVAARAPGEWGEEVPVGTGQVDWIAFFEVLDRHAPGVDLLIEREAGDDRARDVRRAREHLASIGAIEA